MTPTSFWGLVVRCYCATGTSHAPDLVSGFLIPKRAMPGTFLFLFLFMTSLPAGGDSVSDPPNLDLRLESVPKIELADAAATDQAMIDRIQGLIRSLADMDRPDYGLFGNSERTCICPIARCCRSRAAHVDRPWFANLSGTLGACGNWSHIASLSAERT